MKRKALLILFISVICSVCFCAAACAQSGDHNLEKVEARAATCEEDGNIEYYRCTDEGCGKLFTDASGKNETTLEDVTAQKLGHTGGTATCTEKAVCTRCGNGYGELVPHDLQGNWLSNEEGHYKKCGVCQGNGDPVAHVPVTVIRGEAPTCTETGLSAQIECDVCGYVIQEQDTLPPSGHDAEHRAVHAATCEADGYKTEHWYCATCGKYFSDEDCQNEITETAAVEPATGHDFGDWTSNGDNSHTRICNNDSSHTQTVACAGGSATCQAKAVCTDCDTEYGEFAPHTGGKYVTDSTDPASGHREHCTVCNTEMSATLIPHGLSYEYSDTEHWEQCACGYQTDSEAHTPASIVASLKPEVAASIHAGQVLSEQDITVAATCACKNTYTLESGYTIEKTTLIEGNNQLEVTVDGTSVKTTVNADATDAPSHTLTLVGATFAGGGATLSVKAGGKISGVITDPDMTFYGFKDAEQNFYSVADFVMPDADLTITAMYKEDMLHFAPSDRHNNYRESTNTAEHKEFNGVMGTEVTFKHDSPNPVFFANAASDSQSAPVNVWAPVCGKTLMMLTVINNNAESYDITYCAESNGKIGQKVELTLAPNSVTVVPCNYWLTDASFHGCDHQITMVSQITGEVKLGFYADIAIDGNMAVTELDVGGIKTLYSPGERFDFSGVTAAVKVSSHKFACPVYDLTYSVEDGAAWTADITEITVSACGVDKIIKLNDLSDWMGFTFSRSMSDKSWINQDANYTTVEGVDGTVQQASKLTIQPGATAGQTCSFQTHMDTQNTKTQNYNVRIPLYGTRSVMFVVSNTGTTPLSFWLGNNDNNNDGADITVQPGDTNKLFMATMSGNTPGGWMKIRLLSDAPQGGEAVVYGYFQTNKDEFASISVRDTSVHKTAYNVGETLDTTNLVIKPTPSDADQASSGDYTLNCTTYRTEIVGHEESKTFTADDAGKTFTVKVSWNNLETTYTVTVAAV